jgi:holo-[acyl-carrier protein] synthase|tara:strand:+ start:333 stop:725 length:393 start_codon:yes stop_codon:yes gene_type:complete
MKIYGLGTDIVDVKRIKLVLERNNTFKNRIFSKSEISFCEKKNKNNNHYCYAKRFAAKEAFAKSIGLGIAKGLSFNEINVTNNKLGRPNLTIKGESLKTVHRILKKKKFNIFLSLSDDKTCATATVIITI